MVESQKKTALRPRVRRDREDVARALVASYSRGNLSLQRGRYITAKQIEEKKARVLALDL